MTVTHDELAKADCLFDVDSVGGSEMTAFKREARYRQHLWAVEQGVVRFGSHRNSRSGTSITNGTKLTDADAAAGLNFLSAKVACVVEQRLAERQPHETLDATRLHRDLLSSMPITFNLFGHAVTNHAAQEALAEVLAPGVPASEVDVVFEWSPQRLSDDYTNDRTAFDVALRVGPGPQTVVGIETKYHEHAAREATPKPEAAARHAAQTAHLSAIADTSGVFRNGWRDEVLGTDLRQIWRDHLLALSMRAHPERWTAQTRYVLVYPRRNVSFADAARRYADLVADDASFGHFCIEDLLDAAFAGDAEARVAYVSRYLW